jgi:penicillin-insensitive murein DD-endopeptidase
MQTATNWLCWPFFLVMLGTCTTAAQEKGTLHPQPLPPIENPEDPSTPAKEFFARKPSPAALEPAAIGFYSKGCLSGAVPLPIDAPHWQVMRVSRNRYWGHPDLIALLQNVARKASEIGWPGLLIGDIAQPRGGPMLTGHASHQIGLDVDIWFRPMPRRALPPLEREEMMSTVVVAADRRNVDTRIWTRQHAALLKVTAEEPRVERIFVNAAIKKALCDKTKGDGRWLAKMRPWWEHDYHFHVRITCPSGSLDCEPQEPPLSNDGCGRELEDWLSAAAQPSGPDSPAKAPLTVGDLPPLCRTVLNAQ